MGVLLRLLIFVPGGGDTMNGFRNYLFSKGIANDKNVKFYQLWVSQYLDFHKSNGKDDHKIDDIEQFISALGEKYADWCQY